MNYNAFLILIVIVALLLILIIMVQNPKGGGLNSSFGGGGSQGLGGGVQNTNKFLDRATWTLAISLFALILLSNFAIPRDNVNTKSRIENTLEGVKVTKPATTDDAPTTNGPVTTDKKPEGTDK